jgi:hypothetical protein
VWLIPCVFATVCIEGWNIFWIVQWAEGMAVLELPALKIQVFQDMSLCHQVLLAQQHCIVSQTTWIMSSTVVRTSYVKYHNWVGDHRNQILCCGRSFWNSATGGKLFVQYVPEYFCCGICSETLVCLKFESSFHQFYIKGDCYCHFSGVSWTQHMADVRMWKFEFLFCILKDIEFVSFMFENYNLCWDM